jgi:AcrR family transcriptional regulator
LVGQFVTTSCRKSRWETTRLDLCRAEVTRPARDDYVNHRTYPLGPLVQPVVQAAALPRRSFARLPPERRAEILALAAEEFAAHGYHGTSYNRLLARLGLGKSSAYHYFEDKADLLRTTVTERYLSFFQAVLLLPRPSRRSDFWPFIEEINLRGFRFMLDDPTSAALMDCLRREASSFEQVLADDQVLAAVDRYHLELLSLGQQLGAVRTNAPLEHLSFLSRTLASASDIAFVNEVRREGAAKVSRRLRAMAAQWTDAYRRLFEPTVTPTPRRERPARAPKKATRGAPS